MPMIHIKKRCANPLCKNNAVKGSSYCSVHKKQRQPIDTRGVRPYRGPETGARWKKERATYLLEHPYCEDCTAAGIQTKAAMIHHKGGFSNEQEFFDQSRWQGLCNKHHSPYRDEAPPPKVYRKNLIIVFGPPCSGKTYHIDHIKRANEIVVCRDIIATELTGQELHGTSIGRYREIDVAYGRRVESAINSRRITYLPAAKLNRLRRYMGAVKTIKLLIPSKNQCLQYMMADDTRINKDAWMLIVDDWYKWWGTGGVAAVKEIIKENDTQVETFGEIILW